MKRSKDDLLARASALLSENTSDDAIAFMEDLSDSFDTSDEGYLSKEEHDPEMNRLESEWRNRYMLRFAEGGSTTVIEPEEDAATASTDTLDGSDINPVEAAEKLRYEDVFSE